MDLIYLFIVFVAASFLQSITGFGFAIISMPVLMLIFPIRTTAAIVALASFMHCFQVAFKMRKHIDWKIILFPVIFAFIGRLLGMNLLMTANEEILKTLLGVILILMTLYFIFFKNKVKVDPNKKNGMIYGFMSGILGGMFNTGGPPMVMYYFFAIPDKLIYIASIQFTFAVGNLFSIILHKGYGNYSEVSFLMIAAAFAAAFLGSHFGCKTVKKIKDISFYVYLSMIIMGIFLIVESNFF